MSAPQRPYRVLDRVGVALFLASALTGLVTALIALASERFDY